MFTWIWIIEIVLLSASGLDPPRPENRRWYTCEEFELGARFDPYETIDSFWKIFYFWANTTEVYPIVFSLPDKKRIRGFKMVMDVWEPHLDVEWHKATLAMDVRAGLEILLLYAGKPGAFRAVVKMEQRDQVRPRPAPLVKFAEIRMKMIDRYIGMMCCEDLTMYAMARVDEVPETEVECEAAAAKLGFQEAGGRSHLYLLNKRELDDEL